MTPRTILALAMSAALSGSALAQQAAPVDPTAPADPCQVQPEEGVMGQSEGEEPNAPPSPLDDEQLAEMLDRCGSVLTPPPTGDGMVEPPEQTGTTPVIRPGDLPPQQ